MNGRLRSQGFTLVELIAVIVILSILAVIGAHFVVSTTQSYESTRTRALLVNTGRQALERMARQLRGALPYSVRTTNGGQCVQFMPIAGGGNYSGSVPDTANLAAPSQVINNISPHQEEFGTARWVSIGALTAGEIYGPGASLDGLLGRTSTSLTLSSSKTWLRNSINRRFYLLDNPQAFCVLGGQLRFYPDQSIAATDVNPNDDFDLMANNVTAAPFSFVPGNEIRNTVVMININFVSGGESVNFQQQVMIRNVP